MMLVLKDKYVYEWSESIRLELKTIIEHKLFELYYITKNDVYQIVTVGSRSYLLPNSKTKFFKPTSDLDTVIIINTEKFQLLAKELSVKLPITDPLKTIRFSFLYYDIKVSCFIFPNGYDFLSYFNVRTMGVDLENGKIIGQFNIDLYEYLKRKGRCEFEYCYVCEKAISSADDMHVIQYTINVPKQVSIIHKGQLVLCKHCYNRIFANNKQLTKILRRCLND